MTTHEYKWAKPSAKPIDLNKAFAEYHAKVPVSTISNPPMKLVAQPLSVHQVRSLQAIHESTSPVNEALKQQMLPETIMSTVANCQLVMDYMKLKSDFTVRSGKLKGAEKEKLTAEYREAVSGFSRAFGELGLTGYDENKIEAAAKELQADKKAFNAVATMLSTAKPASPQTAGLATRGGGPFGSWNVATGSLTLWPGIGNILASIKFCQQPHTGSFTRHFGETFSLGFTVGYSCWRGWGKGWGTCYYSYTIASLSYSADLQIGYSMNCCGGTAWGAATAQICGSILSYTRCASCSVTIGSAAGVGTVSGAGGCVYGLAMSARLRCEYNGVTLVDVPYQLNYTITGPCPLPGWPC